MYCASKIEPFKSPDLDFDIDFDLPDFFLHFRLVFNLRESFATSYFIFIWMNSLHARLNCHYKACSYKKKKYKKIKV